MFEKFKKKEKSKLDEEIEKRIERLEDTKDDAEKDKERIDNVKELVDIKTQMEGRKEKLNPNTILTGVFSLGSVIAIMIYENRHVFTTKAKEWIPKLRM